MYPRNGAGASGAEKIFCETQSRTTRVATMAALAGVLSEETESLLRDQDMAKVLATVNGRNLESGIDFCEEVTRFEKRLIQRALSQTSGNQARAARLLGMASSTLHYKIRSYGLR